MSRYPSEEVARFDQQFARDKTEERLIREEKLSAANARDAKRYRWLRMNPTFLGWDADYRPDEVDRAVDKEMAE